MRCSNCSYTNPDTATFCGECGTSLAAHSECPGCGQACRPGQKFCHNCGQRLQSAATTPERDLHEHEQRLAQRILDSRIALEGERKAVTVLFADVKDSMDLAAALGPEVLHRVLDRFFTILSDGVRRFGGTVNQFTGDGIMAIFGAPIAREDHAQRACIAALYLRDSLRTYGEELKCTLDIDFLVRIGLNSGEVVVGNIGHDLDMDYTALGHTVGLAQRMESLAEPGQVCLTQQTANLVSSDFELENLGSFQVKGATERLNIYALVEPKAVGTRLKGRQSLELSRFVGRDEEMGVLFSKLEQALAGQGQVVSVVAEAGAGKSRLCFEFLERCRERGLDVFEAHGVSHGKSIPFLPIRELFRALFGIDEQDLPEQARQKISTQLLHLDQALSEALPLLFDFLGVPDPDLPLAVTDAEARQRQLYRIVKQIWALRANKASVILLEDLHWFDQASDALVAELIRSTPNTCNLLLVNFRPEYQAEWMQHSVYTLLSMAPLRLEAIRGMVRDRLGSDSSMAAVVDLIEHRSQGNPFFAEEIVQSLIESGNVEGHNGAYRLVTRPDDLSVPPTVQALLSARIDRLAAYEKELLQIASVIGKKVPESLLREVSPLVEMDSALSHLIQSEFLYETALYPEIEYGFKHPLTQEVVYRSQLRLQREARHAKVLRAIEATSADLLDERAALLAHHAELAGEFGEAAKWHARAAEGPDANDPKELLSHWRSVRRLARKAGSNPELLPLGATACARILALGWRLGLEKAEAEELFEEGCARAEKDSNLALRSVVTGSYGAQLGINWGSASQYLHYTNEATRLAEEAGATTLALAMRSYVGYALWFRGHSGAMLDHCEKMLREMPPDPSLGKVETGYSPYVGCLHIRGEGLAYAGRLLESSVAMDQAARIAREVNEHQVATWINSFRVNHVFWTGGYTGAAMDWAREALYHAEKFDTALQRSIALAALGTAHILDESWDDAVKMLEESLTICAENQCGRILVPLYRTSFAVALAGEGELARASSEAATAVEEADRGGALYYGATSRIVLARILRRKEGARAEGIWPALERAMALAEETEARILVPWVRWERAAMAGDLADSDTRRHELGQALALWQEIGASELAGKAEEALASQL